MWEYQAETHVISHDWFQNQKSSQSGSSHPVQISWNTANGLLSTYKSILIWTFINLYLWALIFPTLILIGYWIKFLHQLNHLDFGDLRDEHTDSAITQISNTIGSLILFSSVIIFFEIQLLLNLSTIESVWSLWVMFLCCGLLWSIVAYREIDQVIEIMSDLYPYYYPNLAHISDDLKKIRIALIMVCVPIVHIFGVFLYIRKTWHLFAIYHKDWSHTKNRLPVQYQDLKHYAHLF